MVFPLPSEHPQPGGVVVVPGVVGRTSAWCLQMEGSGLPCILLPYTSSDSDHVFGGHDLTSFPIACAFFLFTTLPHALFQEDRSSPLPGSFVILTPALPSLPTIVLLGWENMSMPVPPLPSMPIVQW